MDERGEKMIDGMLVMFAVIGVLIIVSISRW